MFSKISPVKKYTFALVVLITAVFGTLNAFRYLTFVGPDEKAYVFYMTTVHTFGIGAISSLTQEYYKVPENERPPSPLRVFFIFTGALSCQIFGVCQLGNLIAISLFSRIILILLAFFWLAKLFDPKIAFASSVLLLFSPAGIWSTQWGLQDSFFALLMIASIVAYHYCWKSEKRWAPLIFGSILVAGFLTKESMVFLYPCFLTAGIYYWRQNNKKIEWRRTLAPLVISPFVYLFIISSLVGGLSVVINHYLFFMKGMDKIGYVTKYQLGPWYRPIIDWMLIAPIPFLLAIVGTVISVSSQKNAEVRNFMALYLISGLLVFGAFSLQNLRYVLFLDVFICSLAVIATLSLSEKIEATLRSYTLPSLGKNEKTISFFSSLVKIKDRRYQTAIFVALLLLIVGTDLLQFYKICVVAKMYDPITSSLMGALHFSPAPF